MSKPAECSVYKLVTLTVRYRVMNALGNSGLIYCNYSCKPLHKPRTAKFVVRVASDKNFKEMIKVW